LLRVEAGLLGQEGREEQEEFVGGAQVAGYQVGQDAAGAVERRGVRVVGFVPGVFEGREDRGRVLGAEEEVALGFVGFEGWCGVSIDTLWWRSSIPSAYRLPAT
jgi:hypothetical protein